MVQLTLLSESNCDILCSVLRLEDRGEGGGALSLSIGLRSRSGNRGLSALVLASR